MLGLHVRVLELDSCHHMLAQTTSTCHFERHVIVRPSVRQKVYGASLVPLAHKRYLRPGSAQLGSAWSEKRANQRDLTLIKF